MIKSKRPSIDLLYKQVSLSLIDNNNKIFEKLIDQESWYIWANKKSYLKKKQHYLNKKLVECVGFRTLNFRHESTLEAELILVDDMIRNHEYNRPNRFKLLGDLIYEQANF